MLPNYTIIRIMANLPIKTITTIFDLQRWLWELIHEATETEWMMFE
jgi:hypothetical protein